MKNVDRCVCCGNIVPEGTMVCSECVNKNKNKNVYEQINEIIKSQPIYPTKIEACAILRSCGIFDANNKLNPVYNDILTVNE